MNNQLVSIIIPVYNAEKYLEESIQSAINQTWPDKEIIIIDDGSTDQSLNIANSYANNNIKVFTQPNKGASAARNRGLQEAKGDYIQFLDADDFLHKKKIRNQLILLEKNENFISTCPTIHFNDFNDVQNISLKHDWLSNVPQDPLTFITYLYGGSDLGPKNGGMVQPNAWLTPRKIIDKAGPWNEELSRDDDGEYFCRIILASKGIIYSSDSINYYRKFDNQQSLSGLKDRKAYQSEIKSINLKKEHLQGKLDNAIIEKIFSRHYWWTGFNCYPAYRDLSHYCLKKAKLLNYMGNKYIGGGKGKTLSGFIGWKATKYLLELRKSLIR